MVNILKPNQSVASIYEIQMHVLMQKGYRHIILDMDNTLTPWNDHQVRPVLADWIATVKDLGYTVCLLSNNRQKKVQDFAAKLGVLAAPKGGKPSGRSFKRAISMMQGTGQDTMVIGDQVFTDILGGNLLGLYTILVDPITTSEFIGTRFTRLMERLIAGRRPN